MISIVRLLDYTIYLLLGSLLIFLPFISIPIFTDSFFTPKIVIFGVILFICLIFRSLSWLINNRILIILSPFDVPLFLFLASTFISSVFSKSSPVSFLGTNPLFEGSFVSFLVIFLFYLLFTSSFRYQKALRFLVLGLILTALVTSLLIFNELFLPLSKYKLLDTNYLLFYQNSILILLPLVFYLTKSPLKLSKYTLLPIVFLLGLAITLTAEYFTYLSYLLAFFILFCLSIKFYKKLGKQLIWALVGVFILSLVIPNIKGIPAALPSGDPQLTADSSFRASLPESLQIIPQALLKSPILGHSLNSFPFIYSMFRETYGVNHPNFAFSQIIQTLISLGVLGFLALIFLIFKIFKSSVRVLSSSQDILNASVASSLLICLVNLLFFPFSFFNLVIFVGLLGIFTNINYSQNKHLDNYHPAHTHALFIYLTFLSVLSIILFTKLSLADYYYKLGDYYSQKRSYNLNPYSDLYIANLAQSSYIQAQSIVEFKRRANSLSKNDEALVKGLLEESFNLAKTATIKNPYSSANFFNLGLISYRISKGDQKFVSISEESFQKAILLDPKNPQLLNDIKMATSEAQLNQPIPENFTPTESKVLIENGQER